MSPSLSKLHEIRTHSGPASTAGLSDAVIEQFCAVDPTLVRAIDEAC